MIEIVALTTLVNNLVIQGVKWLVKAAKRAEFSDWGLRTLLGAFSLVGVFAIAEFTGQPVDTHFTSEIIGAILMAIASGIGAHSLFKVNKSL
jgi:hypothetical protein